MNKLYATFVLVLLTLNLVHAQKGYVKYITNSEYRNGTIKCLKGEIVPFISTRADKVNIIVGNDTITDLPFPSKRFDVIDNPNTKYISSHMGLVQLKENGLVYIDVSNIYSNDTVTIISESGNQIAQLIDKREATFNKSDLGKKFRLIITNAPTLYYSSENLQQFVELRKSDEGAEESYGEAGFFFNIVWWYYLLFVLGLTAIGFVVWKFILKSKLNSEMVYDTYNGNKALSEFARDNNIDLPGLLKFNKNIIDRKYISYDEKDRRQVQKDLKGKLLVVGHQPKNNHITTVERDVNIDHYSFQGNSENISQQLRTVEINILNAIRSSGSRGNEGLNELNRLVNDISALKIEKDGLKSVNQNLDSTISQLRTDKDNLERNIELIKTERNQKVSELEILQNKVIPVGYLQGFCESVLIYLNLCNQVTLDAYGIFTRISKQNYQQQANVAGHLLMSFQNSINLVPVGNWIQILEDIKETGVTNSKLIHSSFKQLENPDERRTQFQRLFFTEVLIKYSSSILILAEAFRNLDRFQVSSDLINDAQVVFGNHVSELVRNVELTGLKNKYVPLFKNFEDFLGQIESVDYEKSLVYNEVVGLENGTIAQIVSYGVKTPFEETKTLIILE